MPILSCFLGFQSSMKVKFDDKDYRSITHNYIALPVSLAKDQVLSDIESLPTFINFMLAVDRFLNDNAENYDLDNVEDVFIEYYKLDIPTQDLVKGNKYGNIVAFNEVAFDPLIKELTIDSTDLHKMRVDPNPHNMNVESWFKHEANVRFNKISDKLVTIHRQGLVYLFELNESGYTCTMILGLSDGSIKQILGRFKDVGVPGGLGDTFTRTYYKVLTEQELSDMKESTANKLRRELGLIDSNMISDVIETSSTGPDDEGKKGTTYDVLDREYVYVDGHLDVFRISPTTKFIQPLASKVKGSDTVADPAPPKGLDSDVTVAEPDDKSSSIIALDLETKAVKSDLNGEDVLEVISACWTNGVDDKSFYITDYDDDKQLLKSLIDSLLDDKYNRSSVYVHNLSTFDGIFLLKTIYDLSDEGYKIDFVYKDDKMISISIKKIQYTFVLDDKSETGISMRKRTVFKITMYDSLLILPASLSKLAKSFGIEQGKMDWDVSTHDTADLNDPIFREGLLNYNMIDCKVLHDVIYKFYTECLNEFKIDILNCPTLPSIAFKLFRSHFMNDKQPIGISWLEQYNKLKPGYRGGHVDVYKPYGKDLYYYDVNSLYPFVMDKYYYPIGAPQYFEYTSHKPLGRDLFGIVMARIKAPDIKAPILLTEVDNKVIAPVGEWEGIYCTEELRNAIKYGYEVQVLWGYHWPNKAKVFSKYVKTLYANRLKYPKSDPKNLISKLMLNSLYGRFGLSPYLNEYMLSDDPTDLHDSDCIQLGSNVADSKLLVELPKMKNDYKSYKISQNEGDRYNLANISLPMAMFVTAYARMVMSKYKVKYADNLYYSDTDSIVLDKPLPDSVVSDTQLGLFKLEHEIQEGVFIAPKVYAFTSKNGDYICKIKGSKHKIDFDTMKSLLTKDSCYQIEQSKWYRSLTNSNITIKGQMYKLQATDNKRSFIYQDDIWVDTKPLLIKKNLNLSVLGLNREKE